MFSDAGPPHPLTAHICRASENRGSTGSGSGGPGFSTALGLSMRAPTHILRTWRAGGALNEAEVCLRSEVRAERPSRVMAKKKDEKPGAREAGDENSNARCTELAKNINDIMPTSSVCGVWLASIPSSG